MQLKNIQNSLKSFKIDNGTYPKTNEGLEALIKNPDPKKYKNYQEDGYISDTKLPKDPWGNDYVFINTKGEITLLSYGSDGVEEGEGKDIYLNECK